MLRLFLPSPGRYSCDGLDFIADSNTVEESYWGQVFIPIFKYDKDNTHEGVTVDFFVRSERAIKLTENDIYIKDFESGLKHKPIRLLITRQLFHHDKYHTIFKADFAITNDAVAEFALFFKKPLDGCSIPLIKYKKKHSKYFMEPIN
jgi:hypothetical protein